MIFPDNVFKAYDIRGLYPQEIDEHFAYQFGQAFAEFMKRDCHKDDITLVVCQDMRESSIPLKQEIIRGIRERGVNVVDIGLASTPTFYFGVSYYDYDGGVQITASHNPAVYNGFKIVRPRAYPISGESGIQDIKHLMTEDFPMIEKIGEQRSQEGVLEEQIRYALSQINIDEIKKFSIVIDTGNGMGAPVVEELFKHVTADLHKLFFELDGNFPNHESNPFKEENNRVLQKTIREKKADMGIALDGDADRVFFFDETGKTIEPAIIRGVLAQIVLRTHPGAMIGYDVRPGKITDDLIREAGGKPFVTRVGHSLIKTQAIEMKSPFSGESSGHFFYEARHGFFEMPALIILNFLHEISQSGKTVSEYMAPFYRYHHSGEINFHVANKDVVLSRLKETFADADISDLDGYTFTYPDVWFNVRASNTESVLRLNLEAISEEKMKDMAEIVTHVINS